MAYINTWKNIDRAKNILNNRYDMPTDCIIDIEAQSLTNIDRIINGFYFGVMQGYKQAKSEERKAK